MYISYFFQFIQFGYGSSTALVQRIKALENWATKNFPHSDLDPGHPDAIVLITGG